MVVFQLLQRSIALIPSVLRSPQQLCRSVSTSISSFMKRPVFEGPEFPKKPLSAYLLFVSDKRPILPPDEKRTPEDSIRLVAEMWRNLSFTEKKVYLDRHDQLKREHEDEVERFLEDLGDEEEQESYLASLTEYRRKRREYIKHFRLKKIGMVKPGSVSGYNMFMKEHREFVHGKKPEEVKMGMKAISEKWRDLSDEEKELYKERAKVLTAEKMKEYDKKYKKAVAEGIVEPPSAVKAKKTRKTVAAKKSTLPKVSSHKKPAPVKSVRKSE